MRTTLVALIAGAGIALGATASGACPYATKDTTAQTTIPAAPMTTAQAPAPVKQ